MMREGRADILLSRTTTGARKCALVRRCRCETGRTASGIMQVAFARATVTDTPGGMMHGMKTFTVTRLEMVAASCM